jgi:predicted HTH transcriptional regulator
MPNTDESPAPITTSPPPVESTPSPQGEDEEILSPPSSIPTVKISPAPVAISAITSLLLKAKEKIQFRKRNKLDKILALAKKQGRVTNQMIEQLLRVSDATATRYLSQLVKEGKLRRVGKLRRPFYEPI